MPRDAVLARAASGRHIDAAGSGDGCRVGTVGEPHPVVAVVDDDVSVRKALSRTLSAAGFSVETFGTAVEFLARPFPPPACLVLDIRMPGMTGFDLQQELAATQPRLPIVMITGHGGAAIRQRALDAGAVAVLDKPFNDQALLDAITHALARRA